MESFRGHMTELLDRQRWKTRIELANAVFDYPAAAGRWLLPTLMQAIVDHSVGAAGPPC